MALPTRECSQLWLQEGGKQEVKASDPKPTDIKDNDVEVGSEPEL